VIGFVKERRKIVEAADATAEQLSAREDFFSIPR
jgi:hypothetical protein